MLENISKRPFYQWDIGAKLRVIEPPGCTIAYVHFCCDRFSDAVVVEVQRGDELTARVPDEFLQLAGKFCAYTVCVHPDGQETVEQSVFRVIQKKRPEGYVYTPTEHRSWEQLDERIKKLETGGTGGGGSGGGGVEFTTDETLSLVDGILSVNTADDAEKDNTLPITSAAVQRVVGNIEVLLSTI